MSGHRILRHPVKIDDQDHEVHADGPVLHVAADRWVEFWTLSADDPAFWDVPLGSVSPTEPPPRLFRIFGTGHLIPDGYVYRGTAERTSEGFMWHLFERVPAAGPDSRR